MSSRGRKSASRSSSARKSPIRRAIPGNARATSARGKFERGRAVPRNRRIPGRQRERAAEIFSRLHGHYPDARCELEHTDPFQLLAATILSAQCTDKRVNMVTPILFARYPSPESMAAADPDELESIIRSTGFFRNKRKSLLGMSAALVELHEGKVPSSMDALVALPGVGRKTANVVLGNAFGVNAGVVVDTHVARLSQRLGLSKSADPARIEQDLMRLFEPDNWAMLAHLLIAHGRRICFARTPNCAACILSDLCPAYERYMGRSTGGEVRRGVGGARRATAR